MKWLPLMALLLVAGCSRPEFLKDPIVLAGSGDAVYLTQSVTVPAGHARVYFQDGAVTAKSHIHWYRTHCNLEMELVSDGVLQPRVGRYSVTSVERGQTTVVQALPPVYAALDDDDGPPMITRFIRYWLEGPLPTVRSLTCYGAFADMADAELPKGVEIESTVGVYINFRRGS